MLTSMLTSKVAPPPMRRNTRVYRSGERKRPREDSFEGGALGEALELLGDNSFSNLANHRAKHIKGTLSWARLAEGVIRGIANELMTVRSDYGAQRAIENARELYVRLEARDAVPHVRVTLDVREKIVLLYKAAQTLHELLHMKAGTLEPNYDTAGRAITFKQKWNLLGGKEQPWIRNVMEQAVSKVLADPRATAGMKAMYNRALSHWLPSVAPVSPGEGTSVQWDSDDDV